MKKSIIFTILFSIIVIPVGFLTNASADQTVSVSIDKTSYNYRDAITISGNVSPITHQLIEIEVVSSTGQLETGDQTNANSDGSYSDSIPIPSSVPAGTYTVVVDYGNVESKMNFSYDTSSSQSTSVQPSQSTQSSTIPQWIRNAANWWANGQIGDSDFIKGLQYLIDNNILQVSNQDELNQLKTQNQNLQAQLQTMTDNYNSEVSSAENLQTQLQQWQQYGNQTQNYESNIQQKLANIQELASKPYTIISNGSINWYFSDSKGTRYNWYIPMSSYDAYVKYNIFGLVSTYNLSLPNGGTVTTYDYTQLAKLLSERKEFSSVVDGLYDNAGSDDQFIYEVWHVVAEMTTYNKDITNNNLWPYEVLTRGEGDCKDKAILIADLLRSSSHTTNWQINLEIMDSDNPDNPQTINHMIVLVNTGQNNYAIEATATPDVNGMDVWAGKKIVGWEVPF